MDRELRICTKVGWCYVAGEPQKSSPDKKQVSKCPGEIYFDDLSDNEEVLHNLFRIIGLVDVKSIIRVTETDGDEVFAVE